jgi:hypothetical protein
MFKPAAAAAAAAVLVTGLLAFNAQAAEEARVRVLHASPDAPAVDVYANGTQVLTNVPFTGASDYLNVPEGSYTFEVRPAGADANSEPVLSATASLEGGTDYTVAAINPVAEIDARVFEDNNAAPAAGKAHVQVIHASPDAPPVDIALKDGDVLVAGLAYGELQGPLPIEAGTYDLEIRLAGTDTVVLPLDGVQLEEGNVYTFTAVGFASGTPGLSVVPLSYTPEASVAAPSTGDGGLADGASRAMTLPLIAAMALAGALLIGGTYRWAANRHISRR